MLIPDKKMGAKILWLSEETAVFKLEIGRIR